jgi:para-aminobenzoate synthetase component 1
MAPPPNFLHPLAAVPFAPGLAAHAVRARYPVWLDGDGGLTTRGAASFLAWNPHRVLVAHGDRLVDERWDPGRGVIASRTGTGDPLAALAAALAEESAEPETPPVPWASGAVLALGFELADWIERLPPLARDRGPQAQVPDLLAAFYDSVLGLDEARGKAWIAGRLPRGRAVSGVLSTLGGPDGDDLDRAVRAAEETVLPDLPPPRPHIEQREAGAVPADYVAAIARIQEHLRAGDIYQVNYSRALRGTWPASPLALYLAHRHRGRVPFGAFLDLGGPASGAATSGTAASDTAAIACFSPERFLARRGDHLTTCPIKGTRPRRADPAADRAEAAALLASEKDLAEHVMIVDLERNDLGRVARPGSVRVDPLFAVESYPAVHHMVSTVHAIARPGIGPGDLLRATFPGGSITGAPKIRAIEILRALEGEPRRIYTGALGYWDAGGDMDLAIPIRTALVTGGAVEYRVGGGIVIDSTAAGEYQETCDKARNFADLLPGAPALAGQLEKAP